MKAQFINLGKYKINEIFEYNSKKQLQARIGKYLFSKEWSLVPHKVDKDTYVVAVGDTVVGHVKILKHQC